MPSDTAPFYAGSTISDSKYFIGYQEQLDTITIRTIGDIPTSINIVGKERIGKSSLLYHFYQTYEEKIESRGKNPREYLTIYLSLEQGNCQKKNDFYQVVAQELGKNLEKRYSWYNQPKELIKALKADDFTTASFYEAMVQFREANILPILCLDEIEALFKDSEEFDNSFYDSLRSLMDRSALMLIIASERDLEIYSRQKKLTSKFFNIGQKILLTGFTENEARDLVRLPQSQIPSSQAFLNDNEQKTALEWGGKNPYLLQIAGLYLWEAKKSNKDIAWAKTEFARQAKRVSPNHSFTHKCLLVLKWVFWRLPIKLGQLARLIGNNIGDLSAWIIGVSIVVIFILAMFGLVPWESVLKAMKNALGLGD